MKPALAVVVLALTGCVVAPPRQHPVFRLRPIPPATLAEIRAADTEAQAAAHGIVFPPTR